MARPKRNSNVLATARQRIAGLKTITPLPNFGESLDLAVYEQEANALSTKIDRYNEALTLLDGLQNDIEAGQNGLRVWNRRVLAAVEAHYGPDSNQYEAVGGTRSSERKRTTKKPPDDGDDNNT